MDIKRYYRELLDNRKNFGNGPTAQWFILKSIYHFFPVKVFEAMILDEVDPKNLKLDPRFQSKMMDASEMLQFVGSPGWDDPSFGLSKEMLERAGAMGVEWYAITDGDKLASVGWYCTKTTINDGMPVYFNPEWAYMFRGYTLPEYRGYRLHGVGMSLAMKYYQSHGLKGLISDVDGRNLSSLKSVYRLGYKRIGYMYLFGKSKIFTDAGCKKYGFRYGSPSEIPPALLALSAPAGSR